VDIAAGTTTDTAAASGNSSPHRASTFKWDTKKIPDGSYQIKVVADDSPSNAIDSKSAEAVSQSVIIDNTPPTVTIDSAEPSDSTIVASGLAKGKLAAIEGVQYKIDDAPDWIAAAPADGLFDSTQARFTVTTATLPPGTHKLTIEAINEAGLSGTTTVTVTVSPKPATQPAPGPAPETLKL
jgi:hypothetical protein